MPSAKPRRRAPADSPPNALSTKTTRPPARTNSVPKAPNAVRQTARGTDSAPAIKSEAEAAPARAPRASRLAKEERILQEAERHFAQFGFEGASLENIAAAAGISRHNLLYYFPAKELLYRRVLDDVLVQWLAGMGALSSADHPAAALSEYIGAKMRSSQERPAGATVFTQEVMAGVPRYADVLINQVQPLLQADVRTFRRWARAGLIDEVDYTHLMFVIWAVTQAYAHMAPQFALLLGKPQLDEADFATAQRLITRLVLEGLHAPAEPDK